MDGQTVEITEDCPDEAAFHAAWMAGFMGLELVYPTECNRYWESRLQLARQEGRKAAGDTVLLY